MLNYSLITNRGKREINEDFAVAVRRKDGIYLFLIADGLGGHGKGDIASEFVIETLKDDFLSREKIDENFISEAFEHAQNQLLIKKESLDDAMTMLTTIVALVLDDTHYQYGWVGDSRIYTFISGIATARSVDHSVPQMLVDDGSITEDEIRNHPDRNKITQAFGVPVDRFGYSVSDVAEYDESYTFLLCTDGFWENILEEDMEKTLSKSKSSEIWLKKQTKIIEKNASKKNLDNYTAIAVII